MAAKERNQSLPGMEDRKLEDLHSKAIEYADVRDRRMKLNAQEKEIKGELLALMKIHKKKTYTFEEVSIAIVPVDETKTVKVKILGVDDEEPDDVDSEEADEEVEAVTS